MATPVLSLPANFTIIDAANEINRLRGQGFSDAAITGAVNRQFGQQSQGDLDLLFQRANEASVGTLGSTWTQPAPTMAAPANLTETLFSQMTPAEINTYSMLRESGVNEMIPLTTIGGTSYFQNSDGSIVAIEPTGPVGAEQTIFTSGGDVIEQAELPNYGARNPITDAAVAATAGLFLGPAVVGLSAPAAAAIAAGAPRLNETGNLTEAAKAAALAGLTAYGAQSLFGGGNIPPSTAIDDFIAADVAQLVAQGIPEEQIADILIRSGVPASTTASVLDKTFGTSAPGSARGLETPPTPAPTVPVSTGGGGTNIVNVLGSTLLPGNTLLTPGTGALLGAGLGSTLATTPGGATATTEPVKVIGTKDTGTTLGSLAGLGGGLGTVLTPITTTTSSTTPVTVEGTRIPETVIPSLIPSGVAGVVGSTIPREVVPVEVPRDIETCPSPEMLISLAKGEKKQAGDLKVGDIVRTQHENTLEWGDHPVVYKEIIPASKRLKVIFDSTEFIGSLDHKFFVAVDKWVKLKDLKIGDIVSGKVVKDIQEHEDGPVVYITVQNAHTYICQDLLSHNKTPSRPDVVGGVVGTLTPTTTQPTTKPTPDKPTDNTLNLSTLLQLLTLLGGSGLFSQGGGSTPNIGGLVRGLPPSDTLIGSTTPQFGPDYYAAVQQYYNAYMPETPRNVAGPLQQWYENKFGA